MKNPLLIISGKLLRVNLSNQTVKTEQTSHQLARRFIGGTGYAAYLLYNEVPKGINPLGPKNRLYFVTGPATGTAWPTAGRMAIVSKSPLTGIWAESHVGGHLGPEMKFAGYDQIIIEGAASAPTVLSVVDEEVQILPGSDYWGLTTQQASKALRRDLNQPHGHVATIGPAGEKQGRFSAIMVDGARAAGRTGLGAVMGSKKLKGILVRGTGNVQVAEPDRFQTLWQDAHQRVQENPQALEMRKYGTPILVATKQTIGELPTHNHREGIFEGWEQISARRRKIVDDDFSSTGNTFARPFSSVEFVDDEAYHLNGPIGPRGKMVRPIYINRPLFLVINIRDHQYQMGPL